MLEGTDYLGHKLFSYEQFLYDRWTVLGQRADLRTAAVAFLKDYTRRERWALALLLGDSAALRTGTIVSCPHCVRALSKYCVCHGQGMLYLPGLREWSVEIRTALRANGFGEEVWPVWSLEDYFLSLLFVAVLGEEKMVPTPKDTGYAAGTWTTVTDYATSSIKFIWDPAANANDGEVNNWVLLPIDPPQNER